MSSIFQFSDNVEFPDSNFLGVKQTYPPKLHVILVLLFLTQLRLYPVFERSLKYRDNCTFYSVKQIKLMFSQERQYPVFVFGVLQLYATANTKIDLSAAGCDFGKLL